MKNERKRNLRDRVIEHLRRDMWSHGNFKVEYFITNSRTDAEFFEAHLIALYKTYKYHNVAKKDWGISEYLPKIINWNNYIEYDCLSLDEFYESFKNIKDSKENDKCNKVNKPVNMYDIYTRKLIRQFLNSEDAEMQTGLNRNKIIDCCNRRLYTVDKEYIFRYREDCNDINVFEIPKSAGKIVQLTKDYSYVNMFKTSQEIADLFNTSRACINMCLNGKCKTSNGYRWMYYADYLKYLKKKNMP